MLAVAALAFYACEKENNIDNNVEVTHYATISLGKADDTKTMVIEGQDGASYKWNDDDDKYLRVTENGTVGNIESFTLSADKTIATLTVSFTGTPEAPYTYEAKYAGSFSNAGNPKLSAEQTPLNDTFDPSADVLYSKTITSDNSRLDELSFTMGRVVTVNKMTLTGLEEGEVISKVEFTLDKVVNGSTSITYHSDSNSYSYSGTKKLTLNYDSTTGVVPADGKFPVYFTAAPVTDAPIISVIVTTDKNVYTKSTSCTPNPFDGKTISFAIGTMKRFNMAMDGYGETISSGTVYTLVQSQDDLYSGATYLIYGSGYVLGEQKTNNRGAVAVTSENNKITIDNTIDAYPVIIEAVSGGYSIKDNNNSGYLYNDKSDKNYLKNTADLNEYTTWTISINGGVAHIDNVNTTVRGKICYNPNNNSPLFAAYSSIPNGGTSDLALYIDLTTAVPDTRAEAGLSWSTDNASASIEDGDVINFTAPTLSNPNEVSGITYESTETSVATVSASGKVTIIAAGTTTIKAIFDGDSTYKPQTVSYTLTVTDNRTPVVSYDFETVAQLNALVTSTSTQYSGYLTNAVVSFVPATNTAIVKDATGSVMIYKSGHGLKQGQTYSGAINVTAVKYNSLYSEITAWDASFTGAEAVVAPESLSLADLIDNYDSHQNAYVQVAGLTVSSVDGKNIHVTDGTNNYVVYDNTSSVSVSAGEVITAIGTITKYQTTEEIKVWKATDVIVTASAPKAITFTQPTGAAATAGCSFTVSVGGSPISSGDTVASGTTVTLTANAGTDYEFTSWAVTGATVADASSASTTFVMGTSAVTISASFTSTGGGGNPTTTTYTFTSKAWADATNSWTSGKDGNQMQSGRGVQVTTGATGANATTKSSLTGVTSVVVTYSTNASNGAGSIAVKIGNNDAHSQNVTKTGGTTDRTLTYTIDPAESGNVTLTVTCTTNSIYVKSVAITHN